MVVVLHVHRVVQVVVKDERVLIICDVAECGASARLLQQQFTERMQCDVAIGQDDVRTWLDQVEHASKGVVLLQTKSVLRQPVRPDGGVRCETGGDILGAKRRQRRAAFSSKTQGKDDERSRHRLGD